MREEEECLRHFPAHASRTLAELQEVDRPADGEAVVVIAERPALDLAVRGVCAERRGERWSPVGVKVVGVEGFIADEFKAAPVKLLFA